MRIVPCSLRKANDFISLYHRHSLRTARNGGKFAIAVADDSKIVGVAIVGNPLSATYMDGYTAEVLRTCVLSDAPKNCNSMLYGACRKIWFGMGGVRILTYTLLGESGASLRGAGWTMTDVINGHNISSWGKDDHLNTRRTQQAIIGVKKRRWESINIQAQAIEVYWPDNSIFHEQTNFGLFDGDGYMAR